MVFLCHALARSSRTSLSIVFSRLYWNILLEKISPNDPKYWSKNFSPLVRRFTRSISCYPVIVPQVRIHSLIRWFIDSFRSSENHSTISSFSGRTEWIHCSIDLLCNWFQTTLLETIAQTTRYSRRGRRSILVDQILSLSISLSKYRSREKSHQRTR